jgi:acyl-CoA synthetase (AMP-forming)/AMP-acid ligase II
MKGKKILSLFWKALCNGDPRFLPGERYVVKAGPGPVSLCNPKTRFSLDDVIKSSGYRIGPFEVESALLGHPAVKEAAVVGSPDDIRGMIVKAFVVLKKDSNHTISSLKTYRSR